MSSIINVLLNHTGPQFRKSPGGEACSTTTVITSNTICEKAADALGLRWVGDIDLSGSPAGCYYSGSKAYNNIPITISSDDKFSSSRGGICMGTGTRFIFNLLQPYISL